jgi:hypothetical protein
MMPEIADEALQPFHITFSQQTLGQQLAANNAVQQHVLYWVPSTKDGPLLLMCLQRCSA